LGRKGGQGRRQTPNLPKVDGKPLEKIPELPRVLVAIPAERQILTEAMDGIIGVAMRCPIHGWALSSFGYQRTDVARNKFVHQLLESDYEYLAMLDSDHKHDPCVVEKLALAAAIHPECKIISGLNFRRGEPYEPMAYRFEGGKADGALMALDTWESGLVEVDAVSTAALLVHREVFEAMDPPWFRYDYYKYSKGVSPSEDIVFFRRLRRETDYRVWVHTQITSPHITSRTIDERDYRLWLELNKQQENEDDEH